MRESPDQAAHCRLREACSICSVEGRLKKGVICRLLGRGGLCHQVRAEAVCGRACAFVHKYTCPCFPCRGPEFSSLSKGWKLPVAPASGDPMPSSGFLRHMHSNAQNPTQTQTFHPSAPHLHTHTEHFKGDICKFLKNILNERNQASFKPIKISALGGL